MFCLYIFVKSFILAVGFVLYIVNDDRSFHNLANPVKVSSTSPSFRSWLHAHGYTTSLQFGTKEDYHNLKKPQSFKINATSNIFNIFPSIFVFRTSANQ